jgi:hypothetical protein
MAAMGVAFVVPNTIQQCIRWEIESKEVPKFLSITIILLIEGTRARCFCIGKTAEPPMYVCIVYNDFKDQGNDSLAGAFSEKQIHSVYGCRFAIHCLLSTVSDGCGCGLPSDESTGMRVSSWIVDWLCLVMPLLFRHVFIFQFLQWILHCELFVRLWLQWNKLINWTPSAYATLMRQTNTNKRINRRLSAQ